VTAETASYVLASNVDGTVTSASYALTAEKGYRSFVGLVTWDSLNETTILTGLQNDNFSISFARNSQGAYTLEDTSGPFLQSKTLLLINQDNGLGLGSGLTNNYFYRSNDSTLLIKVYEGSSPSDTLQYVSIEIRVYP